MNPSCRIKRAVSASVIVGPCAQALHNPRLQILHTQVVWITRGWRVWPGFRQFADFNPRGNLPLRLIREGEAPANRRPRFIHCVVDLFVRTEICDLRCSQCICRIQLFVAPNIIFDALNERIVGGFQLMPPLVLGKVLFEPDLAVARCISSIDLLFL